LNQGGRDLLNIALKGGVWWLDSHALVVLKM